MSWYLVEDGGRLTAVDAGLPGFVRTLSADLAALGHKPADVEAVILTHSDADHTGLAAALRDAGARVLIHADDEPKLRKPGPKSGDASPIKIVPHLWRPGLWRLFGGMARDGGARPTRLEGAETFTGGEELDVPGHPRVLPTPGHTPGHCAFAFESHGALFVGDELCTWNPFTRKTGPQVMPTVLNESTDQCFESLAAIERADIRAVFPGHGEPWFEGSSAAAEHARQMGRS